MIPASGTQLLFGNLDPWSQWPPTDEGPPRTWVSVIARFQSCCCCWRVVSHSSLVFAGALTGTLRYSNMAHVCTFVHFFRAEMLALVETFCFTAWSLMSSRANRLRSRGLGKLQVGRLRRGKSIWLFQRIGCPFLGDLIMRALLF